MKKLIFLFIIIISIFLIYIKYNDNKLSVLSIGDNFGLSRSIYNSDIKNNIKSHSISNFINVEDSSYRVIDLINMIKYNEKIDNKTIQHYLVKSKIIIITIGNNDVKDIYNIGNNNEKIDELIKDYKELITITRSITKEEIIVMGLFNQLQTSEGYTITNNINNMVYRICEEKNVDFINIIDDVKSTNNYEELKQIVTDKIVDLLNKKTITK